ncbi:M48 family metallopeptidase [Deinococcus oregonensis]|uniref:M48 family metallopeptidase n=1 Tax=Deinococcus oregonensis TaxID=1805970 RepID=A0ABV6B5M2_9DEIO
MAAGAGSAESRVEGWSVGGVPVRVRRSARRRTLGLQVRPGEVILHAPLQVPDKTLLAFLDAKRDWAAGHLATYAARSPAAATLADGTNLSFLGEPLTLRIHAPGTQLSGTPAERVGRALWVPSDAPETALTHWYKAAALPRYRELVENYAGELGARSLLTSVKVSDTRTRWGSCTADGQIRLHWALARAPLEVTCYVALHEAAHLLEMNHSPRYWAHVTRLMPDHKLQRDWLRLHGHALMKF